jgi:hypothetical protein
MSSGFWLGEYEGKPALYHESDPSFPCCGYIDGAPSITFHIKGNPAHHLWSPCTGQVINEDDEVWRDVVDPIGASDQVIIKVQLSIETTEEKRQVLAYNEDRSFMFEDDVSQDILNLMGDQLKAYFFAKINDDGAFEIMGFAPEQDW